ncbi:ubiquitin-protein ligase E3B [Uranotaenia lowii]|uniref:ubiquitin-protein ligase E3B n=1 Tax=Uranotaenia lowii TaxID=190385 RepID=UPI00247A4647|nr:ubiquitin-protein ligase E3B [Uranotaenia lowii]
MFGKTNETKKESFLEQTKAAREERANERALEEKRDRAIVLLQRCIRGWMARVRFRRMILEEFDDLLPPVTNPAKDIELKSSLQIYHAASHFLLLWKSANASTNPANQDRLERLCRYLIASLESDSPKTSYIGVALNKDYSLAWIRHIKKLLFRCCNVIEQLKPEAHSDSVSLALYLHTLVAFTSINSWVLLRNKSLVGLKPGMLQLCSNIMGDLVQKGFYLTLRNVLVKGTCRTVITLKPISLTAIMTLSVRPLISSSFSENLMSQFLVQILSVPGIIFQLEQFTQECLNNLQTHHILEKSLDLLGIDASMKYVVNTLQNSHILALLANIVHLYYLEPPENASKLAYPTFTFVVTQLLNGILSSVGHSGGAFSQWHELLGWFTPGKERLQNENLSLIKKQIHLLWNHRIVKLLLGDNLKDLSVGYEAIEYTIPSGPFSTGNLLKRALTFERSSIKGVVASTGGEKRSSSKTFRKIGCADISRVALTCAIYHSALHALSQLRLDILSGLCYNDTVLHDLWLLFGSLGPSCGLKGFIELLQVNQVNYEPPLLMLSLFCDCMTHYVTILDDLEMYEQQSPFSLNDYIALSHFLNTFLYRTIQDQIFDIKTVTSAPLFVSIHTLLLCLYRRDCRRQFAPQNHWLIRDIRPSHFLTDLEKGKKHTQILLQKMPHIIPHEDRVQLFRKFVQNEKAVLGLTESACASPSSALVTVHRDRIVEDGYRQLAALPPHALKGVIRVRFINQQGLDEAGIDQDGVFKEFLEETIKRVFDPSLNLFKTTTEQRLYPSPTSHMQENHLQLFEFVGRMLGKAVYEGIVVDVPFASFFLSQVLGQTQQALYSCMDELPSLDKELYRSLTFIKHYQGDVADLDLTFSVDEDVMGKIVTHELYPGGKARGVNNDNKINYIHYMAYFRMHTQIRDQTAAFIRGFRCIVNPDWLALFSTPELQRLISGDTAPLDLKDLRKHTQYYGGFHDGHRVVGWLWDILAKDFSEEEKKLFLKFVTSCSKPPLLGFAHLEPPFSIRCVEVGDDEDIGDTVGSVIRGFFTIRKKDPLNRLPTSSTCFNLLKLPNYQKKSMLRDKLRYAISSNTGFELS